MSMPRATARCSRARLPWRLLAWLLVMTACPVVSAAEVEVAEGFEQAEIWESASFLRDPDGALPAADIVAGLHDSRFVGMGSGIPNLGITRDVVWIRVALRPAGSEVPPPVILEIAFQHLDRVEFFTRLQDGGILHGKSGDMVPLSKRALDSLMPAFRVPLAAGKTQVVYLRVSTQGAIQLPLRLWSETAHASAGRLRIALMFALVGALLALALYNLLLYIVVRDFVYAVYIVYVTSFAALSFLYSGGGQLLGLAESPWLANRLLVAMIALTMAFASEFAREFLGLQKRSRWLNGLFLLYSAFGFLLAVVSFALPYSVALQAGIVAMAVAAASFMVVGVFMWGSGVRSARYFVLGWSCLIIGVVIAALRTYGILPTNFVTLQMALAGGLIEALLLSMALADRINLEIEEKLLLHREKESIGAHAQELEMALEAASAGFFEIDPEREVLTIDERLGHLLGLRTGLRDVPVGDVIEYLGGNLGERMGKELQKALSSWALWETEARVPLPGGGLIDLSIRGHIVRDDRGRAMAVRGLAYDVSRYKQLEAQLRRSNERLDAFSAQVAHDLRGPLNRISISAGMLESDLAGLEGENDHSELMALVGRIERAIGHMKHRIGGLLDYARSGTFSADPVAVPLAAIFDEVCEDLEQEISARGAVVESQGLPEVTGNREAIATVFENLMENAIRHNDNPEPHVVVLARQVGGHWEVEFRDNGSGVSAERFDAFLQPLGRGSQGKSEAPPGFGLAISDKILRALGGRLVRGDCEDGFAVVVHLPTGAA